MSFPSAIRAEYRVINALLLRDMRTRFGRKLSGWLVMILWPLAHLIFMMVGYMLAHKVAPIGTNVTVFVSTGILPYILCLYPARMMAPCISQNQSLLLFPPVQSLDIIVARGILEIINAFYVLFLFCFGLYIFDIDFLPLRYGDAILALLTTILLGFSIGAFSAVLYKIFKPYIVILIVLMIGAYLTSGALVPLNNLSSGIRNVLWFNPLAHSVEWLRSAYFDTYGSFEFSPAYLFSYSLLLILAAMALDRVARGLIMIQN